MDDSEATVRLRAKLDEMEAAIRNALGEGRPPRTDAREADDPVTPRSGWERLIESGTRAFLARIFGGWK